MLPVIADALRSRSSRVIENCCGPYQNRKGEWGQHMTVWYAGHCHMISVSHIEEIPKLRDVALALIAPVACVADSGNYRNSRGTLGYWATVRSGEHWYMVSVSDRLEPYRKQWWADRMFPLQKGA